MFSPTGSSSGRPVQDYDSTCEKQTHPQTHTKKFRRGRSSRACLSCNKRKVRCDVMRKNHPYEKCTNCFEFGVDCELIDRQTKHKVSSADAVNSSQTLPITPQSLSTIPDVSIRRAFPTPAPALAPVPVPDPFPLHSSNRVYSQSSQTECNEIVLDPSAVLSSRFDKASFTEYLKDTNSSYFMKVAIKKYMVSDDGFDESFFSPNQIMINLLKCGNIFILPSSEICHFYIKSFFNDFNKDRSLINENQFLKDYADLENPPSLLLLHCVLYIGSVFYCSDNPKHQTSHSDSPDDLFNRAKFLYNSGVETRPIPLIQSLILLSQYSETTSTIFFNRLNLIDNAISTAMRFAMHLDQSKNDNLTEQEKLTYKFLFWYLFMLDKIYLLTTTRNYRLDLKDCTVARLTTDELFFIFATKSSNTEYKEQKYRVDFHFAMMNFCELMVQVSHHQNSAFTMGLKGSPVSHIISHNINMINNWYNSLPESLLARDTSSFHCIIMMYYNFLKFSVFHNSIVFRGLLVRKCTRSRSKTLRKAIVSIDLEHFYDECTEIFHNVLKTFPLLLSIGVKLRFSAQMLESFLHIAITSSYALYHKVEKIRSRTKRDFDLIHSLMPQILEKCFDNNSGGLFLKVGYFFFDKLYTNEERLIDFLRDVIQADAVESFLGMDSSSFGDDFPFDLDQKDWIIKELPPVTPPIIDIQLPSNNNAKVNDSNVSQLDVFEEFRKQDSEFAKRIFAQLGSRPIDDGYTQIDRFLPQIELPSQVVMVNDTFNAHPVQTRPEQLNRIIKSVNIPLQQGVVASELMIPSTFNGNDPTGQQLNSLTSNWSSIQSNNSGTPLAFFNNNNNNPTNTQPPLSNQEQFPVQQSEVAYPYQVNFSSPYASVATSTIMPDFHSHNPTSGTPATSAINNPEGISTYSPNIGFIPQQYFDNSDIDNYITSFSGVSGVSGTSGSSGIPPTQQTTTTTSQDHSSSYSGNK